MDTASYPHGPRSKIVSSQSLVFLVPSSFLHLLCVTFTCVMLAGCSSDQSVVANTGWARLDDTYLPARYGPRNCGRAAAKDVTIAFTSLMFVVIMIALVVSALRVTKRFTHRLKRAGIILPILALICDSVAVGTFTGSCMVGFDESDVDVSLILGFIMVPILLIICALQIADHRKASTATNTAGARLDAVELEQHDGARLAAVELEQHQDGARLAAVELQQYQEDWISPPVLHRPSPKIISSQSRIFLVPSSVLHLLCATFTCVMLAGSCSIDPTVVTNTAWANTRGESDNYYGPRGCGGVGGHATTAFTSLLFVVIVIAFVVSAMRLTNRFNHRLIGAGIVLPILALICDSVAVGTFTSRCMAWRNDKVAVSLILGFTMIPVLLIILALQIVERYKTTSTATTVTTTASTNDDRLKQFEARLAAVELAQQQHNNLGVPLAAVELQQEMYPSTTYYNSPVMI